MSNAPRGPTRRYVSSADGCASATSLRLRTPCIATGKIRKTETRSSEKCPAAPGGTSGRYGTRGSKPHLSICPSQLHSLAALPLHFPQPQCSPKIPLRFPVTPAASSLVCFLRVWLFPNTVAGAIGKSKPRSAPSYLQMSSREQKNGHNPWHESEKSMIGSSAAPSLFAKVNHPFALASFSRRNPFPAKSATARARVCDAFKDSGRSNLICFLLAYFRKRMSTSNRIST